MERLTIPACGTANIEPTADDFEADSAIVSDLTAVVKPAALLTLKLVVKVERPTSRP
jgi:hypothetical protein